MLMLVSLATGRGLQKQIKHKISGFSGHIQITAYNLNASFEQQPVSSEIEFFPNGEVLHPEVRHIQRFGLKAGIIKSETEFEGVVLKGIGPEYDWKFFEPYITEGKLPGISDTAQTEDILMSSQMARLLNAKIGDRLQMYFIREAPKPPRVRYFTLSGIYTTGLEDFDKLYLFGDLRHVQSLNNWGEDQVGGFELILKNVAKVDDVSKTIRAEIPYDLEAVNFREQNEQIFQWIDLFDINIYIIIIIMVAVAIINMISILLIIILEKTNFIGIVKALGLENNKVQVIFLNYATWLIIRGMLIGNFLGLGICAAQHYFKIFKLDPETYYVSEVPIAWDIPGVLLINIGTLAVCYLAMIGPSFLVTKISPVKAIRFN